MARKTDESTQKADLPAVIPCAHQTCGQSAMCRVKLSTGWAKLCLYHYEAHFGEQGKKAMQEHGLIQWADESKADFGKRVREYWRLLARKSPISRNLKDAA
jgi:hypothetical protein